MNTTLKLEGGPMAGVEFDAELGDVLPDRLMGRDIHRTLLGTYELRSCTQTPAGRVAVYRLRMDMDYMRLTRHRVARIAERQRGRLG